MAHLSDSPVRAGPGVGTGKPGDLFLRIHIAPHPIFRLDGRDLLVTVFIAPWEAALGAKIEVPTLDGPVSMTLRLEPRRATFPDSRQGTAP